MADDFALIVGPDLLAVICTFEVHLEHGGEPAPSFAAARPRNAVARFARAHGDAADALCAALSS